MKTDKELLQELIDANIGLEADLQELVRQVLRAKDLEKLKELTRMNYPDESIDTSDIPELGDEFWDNAKIEYNSLDELKKKFEDDEEVMADGKSDTRLITEALKSIHELWGGDNGFIEEINACNKLRVNDSPMLSAWRKVCTAMSIIENRNNKTADESFQGYALNRGQFNSRELLIIELISDYLQERE